jgi:hypothetical protein
MGEGDNESRTEQKKEKRKVRREMREVRETEEVTGWKGHGAGDEFVREKKKGRRRERLRERS